MKSFWSWVGGAIIAVTFISIGLKSESVPKFGSIKMPKKTSHPNRMMLILHEDKEWAGEAEGIAKNLAADNNLVAIINLSEYRAKIAAKFCSDVVNDLDELAKALQKKVGVSAPLPVVIIGRDEGAEVAYLAQKQSAHETFAGFVAINDCAKTPPVVRCSEAYKAGPQVVVQEEPACEAIVAATGKTEETIYKAHREYLMESWREILKDKIYGFTGGNSSLENEDVTVQLEPENGVKGDTAVIFYSGDGGWASFVNNLSLKFTHDRVPVIGVNSLRYFWTAKTPEQGSKDLHDLMKQMVAKYRVQKFHLIGFSFGAEVLPFFVNQLPEVTRKHISRLSLISPGKTAEFQFHWDNWLGGSGEGLSVKDQIEKLPDIKLDCLFGKDQKDDSLCPELTDQTRPTQFSGGHFLNWEVDSVYQKIR